MCDDDARRELLEPAYGDLHNPLHVHVEMPVPWGFWFNSVRAALKSASSYFDGAAAASALFSAWLHQDLQEPIEEFKARKKQSQKQRRGGGGTRQEAKPHSHEDLAEDELRAAPADLFDSDETRPGNARALEALVENSQNSYMQAALSP